jgi:hypothetical protein
MLISKVIGEKLADKEMKEIYGKIHDCNCLPGCECEVMAFYPRFDAHMTIWEVRFLAP